MEYVIVVYPARREVFIDGESQGFNKWENGVDCVLRLGAGQHRFTLGGPLDFTPDVQDVVVEGTNPIDPLRVVFAPRRSH